MAATRRNRLATESSAYLRQHAENPVDWYPWGPEAFERARSEQRPVLLSVGYSACHWCHVMEHESFSDERIAAIANRHFVCIKVDREERPDVDEVYMRALQLLTGRGGWPMTVFLTPEGDPFHAGTYFPPEDRGGMPGFPRVLESVADAWQKQGSELGVRAGELRQALQRIESDASPSSLEDTLVAEATTQLATAIDERYGGLGAAPKFPNCGAFELFLRQWSHSRDGVWLERVTHTLRAMALGGIRDHLGGGFHRYSTDARWVVPHFEKMLYDNALLAPLFADSYRASGDAFFLEVAAETLAWAIRDMQAPEGGFHATQDADTEGEEGKHFAWTPAQVREVLGDDDATIFCAVYDVSEAGNFEGANVLHRVLSLESAATRFARPAPAIDTLLREARARLFAARQHRAAPARDDKILTDWNGLMISACCRVHLASEDPAHLEAAERAMAFARESLWTGVHLWHMHDGDRPMVRGFLDDYAALGNAAIDLYERRFEAADLHFARDLADVLLARFWDEDRNAFFLSEDVDPDLPMRPLSFHDGSVPAGNSMAARLLLRLDDHLHLADHRARAEALLKDRAGAMRNNPFGYTHLLAAADHARRGGRQLTLAGPTEDAAAELEAVLREDFIPDLALARSGDAQRPSASVFAAAHPPVDRPTAWLCHAGTCTPAIHDRGELAGRLREVR